MYNYSKSVHREQGGDCSEIFHWEVDINTGYRYFCSGVRGGEPVTFTAASLYTYFVFFPTQHMHLSYDTPSVWNIFPYPFSQGTSLSLSLWSKLSSLDKLWTPLILQNVWEGTRLRWKGKGEKMGRLVWSGIFCWTLNYPVSNRFPISVVSLNLIQIIKGLH